MDRRRSIRLLAGAACLSPGCVPRRPRIERAAGEGILLLGNGSEPRSLDPHIASGVTEHHVLMALFEGLIADDPAIEDVEPGVAERWEASASLDVWTFHLRANARWSNGDPVVAGDFVFAYRRLLTAKIASEYAEILYVIRGAEAYHQGHTADFATVGARALDDHTLEITLEGPTPYFPKMLQHYCFFPVHRPTIEKFGPWDERRNRWTRAGNLVGNGAFQLEHWRFKHVIELGRNPHYWDAARVRLRGIHYFPIDNAGSEERMFRDGQLHITETLPLDKIPVWRAERPDCYREDRELAVNFYRINTTRGALADPRVRQALAFALDRESLVKNVLRGGQPPAYGLVPPVGGYEGPTPLSFDPARAQSLLAQAGFPDGRGFPRFAILINTQEAHRTLAEAIQEIWRQNLGINVGINNQDWQVYLDSQQSMDYDICRAGWTADYADPMTFLDMWTTGNGQNETGWGNAEYDSLIAEARRTADQTRRFEILRRAEEIFLSGMPVIPIYFRVNNYLVSPMVRNWPPKLLNNHPFKYVELAAAGGG